MPVEGLLLPPASIQTQIIVKGIKQKWNSNNNYDMDVAEEILQLISWQLLEAEYVAKLLIKPSLRPTKSNK